MCFRQAYLPYFLLYQNVKEQSMNNTGKIVFSSIKLRCSLTSRMQCQCQPNAERWELALKSYAEVQPDFANAMSVPTECRAMRTGSQKLCWGAAWLRECKDTTSILRNPNFFCSLISHLESFPHPQRRIQPFIYRHSGTFSTYRKKWNRNITLCPK